MPPHRRDGFLLAAACFLIGITFGVFADSSGLGLGQASVLSVFTFTGASQFALVSVAAGGGTSVAAVGGALLIGARNALSAHPSLRCFGKAGCLGRWRPTS